MTKLKIDSILDIVNEEKKKRGLDEYIPLYPMLRCENDKLYIGVLLTHENDNIWDKTSGVKPEYWAILDTSSFEILEFNKTSDKTYVVGDISINKNENDDKELSMYSVNKAKEYKNYLLDDIKNDKLPIQKKLSDILNNEFDIDGEKVNIDDYLLANIDPEITKKIDELVDLLVTSKYSSITYYYENILNSIIEEYTKDKTINKDKMNICIQIMNIYYFGINGIKNFFGI